MVCAHVLVNTWHLICAGVSNHTMLSNNHMLGCCSLCIKLSQTMVMDCADVAIGPAYIVPHIWSGYDEVDIWDQGINS